jgi:hypothetical protein
MAIVKAKYTKHASGAKASIRYIAYRPGKDGQRITRPLFGIDGGLSRQAAYGMIDQAEEGSVFFRFVISPDPKGEDKAHDLHLREITERTMQCLEERLHTQVSWVAALHDDHAPHRHTHVIAVVNGRLNSQDFQALRQEATQACLDQRRQLDLAREHHQTKEQEEQWELQY